MTCNGLIVSMLRIVNQGPNAVFLRKLFTVILPLSTQCLDCGLPGQPDKCQVVCCNGAGSHSGVYLYLKETEM